MTRVLVVNHAHSPVCGIHDLGKRMFNCLAQSHVLNVDYAECSSATEYQAKAIHFQPDVVIVNHRDDLTPWAGPIGTGVPVFAVLHQYEESTADARARALMAHGRFDHILALDPLLQPAEPRLHAIGRPIPETIKYRSYDDYDNHPYVGSFGFAFPHKGFDLVAREITALGRGATYNLHMPEAYFNGAQGAMLYTHGILNEIHLTLGIGREIHRGPSIDLVFTAEHLDERQLVNRLSMNDVNCLLYHPGQPDAGLSSALDYLIATRRPMLLSGAAMFRHGDYWDDHEGMVVDGFADWPTISLGQVLEQYDHWQQCADELYAWHHGRLVADVEHLLERIL